MLKDVVRKQKKGLTTEWIYDEFAVMASHPSFGRWKVFTLLRSDLTNYAGVKYENALGCHTGNHVADTVSTNSVLKK